MSTVSISETNGLVPQNPTVGNDEIINTTIGLGVPSLIGHILYFISWVSVKILEVALITLPSWLLNLLSTSFSITLSFTSLLLILGSVFVASLLFVRYRALTGYSKVLEERREPPRVDAFLDEAGKGGKRRFGSYLDEFLIAIKVFGYLEKPVFNELTKSMRTQKLDTNEVLDLEAGLGFAIVCEGNVQIFSKVENKTNHVQNDDEFAGETFILNGERYQLLNEVKTGNALSSLIDILTLFTDEDPLRSSFSSPRNPTGLGINQGLDDRIDPLNLNGSTPTTPDYLEPTPKIIARATADSTIAIIPADAFKRLKHKHPRASSHIVQMILTRLYRVTFQTVHNYLGLTRELFDAEIRLNNKVKLDIPSYLKEGLLKRFTETQNHSSTSSFTEGTRGRHRSRGTPGTPQGPKRENSNGSVLSPNSRLPMGHMPKMKRTESRHVVLHSRDSFNPGDLLSNVPLSRQELHTESSSDQDVMNRTFSAEEETEETSLRIALVEQMFRFMGVDRDTLIPRTSTRSNTSVLNSPASRGFETYHTFQQENTPLLEGTFPRLRTMSIASSTVNDFSSDQVDFEQAKLEFAEAIDLEMIKKDTVCIEENSGSKGLYYVLKGEMEVYHTENGREHLIHTVRDGGVAGYLGAMVRYKSFVSVRAKTDSVVAFLSNKDLERLCEKYFMIYLSIAKSLIESLNPKVLKLDSALEWIHLDAGDTLFKQNTDANGIYIILSGRLRSLQENPSTQEVNVMGEYGQGESFGELEVLTAAKRSSTFVAVRDSEAARIPRTLFEILSLESPSIMIKVSRIVAKTMQEAQGQHYDMFQVPSTSTVRHTSKNYRTITILPTTAGLPVSDFASRLVQAFKAVNVSVIGLDQASTLTHLGKYAFDKLSRLRQSGYFSDLEERYEIVVYIADTAVNSSWTSTCIQQADCILLMADAGADPAVGDYERLLLKARTTARTELILLHPEKYVEPGLTGKWLKNRIWVHSHHHIQLNYKNGEAATSNSTLHPKTPMTIALNIKSKVENLTSKYINSKSKTHYNSPVPHKNDFLRLARLLSGQAVGLVLGGGGARGFSHLGILRALQDNGIPVDIIGGTSIGSFIGGLYARDYDLVPIYGRAKKFAGRVGSLWRTLSDLTIPITAYTTGHEFNRGIWKALGGYRIEDFWIQYYCNSTNITNSCMEIHSSGIAWRFIRASMSLAGLLPPITDNGSMLLDGGYVDNLPVEEMKNRGASIIFAVDVGSVDDRTPMTYGDSLSGMWAFFNKWNPFSSHPNVPAMSEIQMRLCYVSSVNALERAKNTPGVIYLRPPIENYATLDFAKFEEIYNVGSVYGHMVIKELMESGKFPKIAAAGIFNEKENRVIQRRNSI
ncbi:Lysophospholipase NTE1 [Cyberlindnera fabianii]|uniref:Lysophospholipase NTE1 n=1 Tax=Cyberlindnera fabianii TaxID=36022 RepID=A0A1V2LBP4_CYBFA|nr:Lysophospholipase NTE1 [Cyberlindnera fabianii]